MLGRGGGLIAQLALSGLLHAQRAAWWRVSSPPATSIASSSIPSCRMNTATHCSQSAMLAHIARVAEGVPSRLRPHCQPVRFVSHRECAHLSSVRVDTVDDIVKATRHPEDAPNGADVAHIGAPAAGNGPRSLDGAGREIDHGYAAWSAGMAMHSERATVGDIELAPIAGNGETMRANASRDEAFERHCL